MMATTETNLPKGAKVKRIALLMAVLPMLATGCATKPVAPIVSAQARLAHIAPTMDGGFCITGTRADANGVAQLENDPQHAIGHCVHPRLDRRNVVILYFGDSTKQAPDEYLDEDLDAYLHPDDYLTEKEVAELDCTDGSRCNLDRGLMQKGLLIHFDTDSDVPNSDREVAMLAHVARAATRFKVPLAVTGNADSTSTEKHNVPLSVRRANAVAKILEANGVDASHIVVDGRGAFMPIASNKTPAGRAMNRRTSVLPAK